MAVLGPTNTGKTHFAVERLCAHDSGMIGLPLRLLAREVFDRVVAEKGEAVTALITGEERIIPKDARYWVCTVESMPLDREVACLAVDEIQLCADPDRGHVFTDRLLHARGTEETLFLGAETMKGVIRVLLPKVEFITRSRFSELSYTGPRKLSRLPRRSAVVAFSIDAVYGLAELMRRQKGGAAVVMGALSPRTRNAQVELYQSGDVDFMVATDAIGMGLNMDVDHVAFASTRKFDGRVLRPLRPNEAGQIAGRAGRHMNDGTFGTTGDAAALDAGVVEQVEAHRFDPVRSIFWRNPDLEFGSLNGLIESLEALPPQKGLVRAREAVDLRALKALSEEDWVADAAKSRSELERLWQVCQIPDFRNVMIDEHVKLLATVFRHLIEDGGRLPHDWVAGQVDRLNEIEGDVDMLAARIAHIRTWTFISHRANWLDDPDHWQARTREIEDRLSDALHEELTKRFIDRRTSVLMRRLKQRDDLMSSVSSEGEVTVEDEYVGKLLGFRFVPDPRAKGIDSKALRAAALKALRAMINARAEHLVGAADHDLSLSEHGRIWWESSPVARLVPGPDSLRPQIEILADDLLEPAARTRIEERLKTWLDAQLRAQIAPLMVLHDALQAPAPKSAEDPPSQEQNGPKPSDKADMPGAAGSTPAKPNAVDSNAANPNGSAGADAETPVAGLPPSDPPPADTPSSDTPSSDTPSADERQEPTPAAVSENPAMEQVPPDAAVVSPDPAPQAESAPAPSAPPAAAAAKNSGPKVTGETVSAEAPPALSGLTRGVAFQLTENLGLLNRRKVAADVKALDQDQRAVLRRFGVRFGEFSLFMPALLKPQQARLLVILWAVHNRVFEGTGTGESQAPAPPPPGLTSVPVEPDIPEGCYAAAGFRVCGKRAVRVDMLERLGQLIRAERDGGAAKPEAQAKPGTPAKAVKVEIRKAKSVTAAAAGVAGPSGPPSEQASAPADAGEGQPPAEDEGPQAVPSAEEASATAEPGSQGAGQDAAGPSGAAPAAEQPAPWQPNLPRGAFRVTPEMMSLVGCSGDEFESILKALGYRSMTLRPPQDAAEGSEAVTAWRLQSREARPKARAPRRHGAKGADESARTGADRPGRTGRPGKQSAGKQGAGKQGAGKQGGGKQGNGQQADGAPAGRHGKGKSHKGDKAGGKWAKQGQPNRKPQRKREERIDPNSPFAALAALKETLKR